MERQGRAKPRRRRAISRKAAQAGNGIEAEAASEYGGENGRADGAGGAGAALITNRDELRQDRDEWRGRAERPLTDQRTSWWKRLAG